MNNAGKFCPEIKNQDNFTMTDGEGRLLCTSRQDKKNKSYKIGDGADEVHS